MRLMTLHDLQGIMRECAGADESVLPLEEAPDESFTDLGYDSISLLETQSRIRQDYGVEFSDGDLADVATPRDFVSLCNSRLAAA